MQEQLPSCNVHPFRNTARRFLETFKMVCLSVLRPFARPCFQGFFATTASADFSHILIREISPGKTLKLSARAAKLYLIRLSVTVGFRVP
jgi:hypothetical protein